MITTDLGAQCRAELLGNILPWWEANALDSRYGGVFTCFSNDGHLASTEKYTWSQGRWAWLCARIATNANLGVLDLDGKLWRERALETARFIHEHAVLEGRVTAYRTTAEGQALPSGPAGEISVSVLADLFAALGLAGAAGRATGQEREAWIDTAHDLLDWAQTRVGQRVAPSEPYPVRQGFTDAASLMLLLHVGAELNRVSGSDASRSVVRAVLARLFSDTNGPRMWHAETAWEFQPAAENDLDSLLARHRNPGHTLELLWMVADAVDIVPELSGFLPSWLPDLATRTLDLGWDTEHGGLFRFVDVYGGQPRGGLFGQDRYEDLVTGTWDTKLWWVHVEALLAAQRLGRKYGRQDLQHWSERLARYTFATFPDPGGQEWIHIRDRHGRPMDKIVALPVKDPFHIARALLLLTESDTTTGKQ